MSDRLVARSQRTCGCVNFQEERSQFFEHDHGTMTHVLHQLDINIGLPVSVAAALTVVCPQFHEEQPPVGLVSPTWSFDCTIRPTPAQMPIISDEVHASAGLSAKFVRAFVQEFAGDCAHEILVVTGAIATQIPLLQVPCTGEKPLCILALLHNHWTLVTCCAQGDTLSVIVYDGLAYLSLSAFGSIAMTLKKAWKLQTVSISSTWKFQQTRPNTCGTIALAHLGWMLDLLSLEQAVNFEHLHEGLALCSQGFADSKEVGFGPDEEAAIGALAQILPSKGVPEAEVRNRAQAALKAFGSLATQQESAVRIEAAWQ